MLGIVPDVSFVGVGLYGDAEQSEERRDQTKRDTNKIIALRHYRLKFDGIQTTVC